MEPGRRTHILDSDRNDDSLTRREPEGPEEDEKQAGQRPDGNQSGRRDEIDSPLSSEVLGEVGDEPLETSKHGSVDLRRGEEGDGTRQFASGLKRKGVKRGSP